MLKSNSSSAASHSFTYTFSPGRSPFNEELRACAQLRYDGYDKTRVTIDDSISWGEEKEDCAAASAYPIQILRRELTGGEAPPGYLHTDSGLLSGPHGVGERVTALGESFFGRTSNANDEGRVTGRLSELGNGIHITTSGTLIDFTYQNSQIEGEYNKLTFVRDGVERCEWVEVRKGINWYPEYKPFGNAEKEGEIAIVSNFLDAKLQSEFSYRYVLAASTPRPDVYEWRRRLDSYVLDQNIDQIKVLNLVDLAEAYSKRLERCGMDQRMYSMSELSLGSASQASLVGDSAAKSTTKSKKTLRESIGDHLSHRLSLGSPTKPVPRFTDKKLELQGLQLPALQTHLSDDVNDCLQDFSGIQNKDHTGCLNFESNTLILSPEYMQYATQTVQNIRADLFLRRVRLAFIISCLEDTSLPLWLHNENKIGLCETLLNDLEHPLIPSDQAETIAVIKSMRDDPAIPFDYKKLIEVANHLFEQAQTKADDLIDYCENLKTLSPAMIWKTTKNLLRKTNLVEQLSALAEHPPFQELAQFSKNCDDYLKAPLDNRTLFEAAITQSKKKDLPVVIKNIIKLIQKIIKNTKSPFRENFLEAITEKEMKKLKRFDPFLMYTITKILQPRQILIEKIKQLEKLNAYYILLKICGAWNAALKTQLEDAIERLQQEKFDDGLGTDIKTQVLSLSCQYLDVLYKELNLKRQYYHSKVIDHYIEGLYLKIAEISQSRLADYSSVKVQQYFAQRYHDTLSHPNGFSSFDEVTKIFIKSKAVTVEANLDNYLMALFFRHFYVGLLFRDYLRYTPQELSYRIFLYRDFASAESPWSSVSNSVEHIKSALSREIKQEPKGHVAERDGLITTSNVYIQDLEEKLQPLHQSLSADYFDFISLCVWISALVNYDFFSQTNIDNIHSKIEVILAKAPEGIFTDSLLGIMTQAWRAYLSYEVISQKASKEWLTDEIDFSNIQELCQRGQELFTFFDESTATDKTIWLNAALQFCYTIKGSLQATDRRSSRLSTKMDRLLKEGSDKRRSYIFQILVMVLTNQNLSPWQRERLQAFKKELVKCDEIRDLALSNIVGLMSHATGSKKHFIGSQVPDLIFYSDQCEIFADPSFPKKVNDELFFPGQNDEALTIDKFIGNLLVALEYVAELAQKKQYRVFLSYIMEPLFTSFSVIYYYLTTVHEPVPKKATALWYGCIQEIKKIGEIVNKVPGSVSEYIPDSSDKYAEFATVWEEIRDTVVLHCPDISFNSDVTNLNSQVNLYHFTAAHEVCVKLKDAGFRIDSAIKEIASQWYKVTNYSVNALEIRALNMILMERYHVTYERKHDHKRARLSAFFMQNVKQVLRLGRVFFVLVSDDFPKLYSRHFFEYTGKIGLDKIADDLQKIYTIRLGGWRIDNNYPAPFRYPVVLVYRPANLLAKFFGSGAANEVAYDCIEIYEERGVIVRRDCSVRDSSWISRASAVLPVANEARSLSLLEQVISDNHCFSVTISSNIFPKFFEILLELLDDSMRAMKLHHPLSPPLSCAFLSRAYAVYNDPRALTQCSENQLIGLFFLGLIYEKLEQQEKKQERVAAAWFLNLPTFFRDAKNVERLGENGIVKSGILETKYGSSGRQEDPIATELKKLDESLPKRQFNLQDQGSYCAWFKTARLSCKAKTLATSSGESSATSLSLCGSDSKE